MCVIAPIDVAPAQDRSGSFPADLGTPETTAALQIADIVNRPDEVADTGSANGCFWDVASVA